jgi:hypothetical protein
MPAAQRLQTFATAVRHVWWHKHLTWIPGQVATWSRLALKHLQVQNSIRSVLGNRPKRCAELHLVCVATVKFDSRRRLPWLRSLLAGLRAGTVSFDAAADHVTAVNTPAKVNTCKPHPVNRRAMCRSHQSAGG